MSKSHNLVAIALVVALMVSALASAAVRDRVYTIFEKVMVKIFIYSPAEATMVANTGEPSNPGSYTISTPTKADYQLTCPDADGCQLFLGETSLTDGEALEIINVGTNSITVADASGVTETAGTLTLGAYDNVSFRYIGDRWVQMGPVGNN